MSVTDERAPELFRAVGTAAADEKLARESASGDGYGACPKCLKVNPPNSARERTPNGNTVCGACGEKTPSRDWQSAAQAEYKAAQHRSAIARVALVDAAMEAP